MAPSSSRDSLRRFKMLRRFATVIQSFAALALFCAAPAACLMESPDPQENVEANTDEANSELLQAGEPCSRDCQCALGTACKSYEGAPKVCTPIGNFSPPPPSPLCAASCQCPGSTSCVFPSGAQYGTCQAPTEPCSSDCDCGISMRCSSGTCTPDFKPYPACRCNKHCPSGKTCVSGSCQ